MKKTVRAIIGGPLIRTDRGSSKIYCLPKKRTASSSMLSAPSVESAEIPTNDVIDVSFQYSFTNITRYNAVLTTNPAMSLHHNANSNPRCKLFHFSLVSSA
jgi:hypothetical protein